MCIYMYIYIYIHTYIYIYIYIYTHIYIYRTEKLMLSWESMFHNHEINENTVDSAVISLYIHICMFIDR
jgi:hypothetical protein